MAAIITEKFRTHNAKQFIEDFSESGQSNYVFIGRSHDWTDENDPPAPANSESEEIAAFEDMIALKKVSSTDISHGLVRYDWTTGTKYDEWRDNYSASNTTNVTNVSNFFDGRGYVITDEFKVYKCIRTGTSGGSTVNSTVKPTSVSTTVPEATSDGYLWKFMYAVTASDVIKFVTNDFIPVKTLGAKSAVVGSGTNGGYGTTATDDGSAQWDVENAAVDGAIYHYVVTAAGSGYNNGSTTTFTLDQAVQGDGSGAVATLSFTSGALTSVAFKDASSYGTGYKRASFATLNSGITGLTAGSGATIHAVISPIHGHGANPIEEMGGNYAIVNSRLEFGEGAGDFPTDNDFRRIGLIKNPVQSSDSAIATGTSMTATNKMTVASGTNISVDDILTDAGTEAVTTAKVRVVSKSTNDIITLPVVNVGGEYVAFANSDEVFVNGAGTKSTDVTADGVSKAANAAHPEMTRFTGQVLYVENRGAVTRAADQIEDIKLIIEM